MTIHWKAVEQYFTVLVVFQFYSVCNFGKFINFGLGTVRSEKVTNTIVGETVNEYEQINGNRNVSQRTGLYEPDLTDHRLHHATDK